MITQEAMRVKSNSQSVKVAGAIASVLDKNPTIELHAIGAGAVNQALKAVAIARGYVAPQGIDLVCVPGFFNVTDDGEVRTAMRLIVKKC